MPLLGVPHQNIDMMFGEEKLEWCVYPTVENV